MSASIIATLFAANVNKTVVRTERTGEKTSYTVSALADKIGTMKNGDKAEYLVLSKVGDDATVINVHPQQAKELLTKGAASGLEIDLLQSVVDAVETSAEVVETSAVVNTEEQQADKPEAVTMNKLISDEKSDKPVSKKARAIEMITAGWKNQLVRKDIIAQMMTELGLSAPGASTYYQNVKSGMWKSEETTEQAAD